MESGRSRWGAGLFRTGDLFRVARVRIAVPAAQQPGPALGAEAMTGTGVALADRVKAPGERNSRLLQGWGVLM